MNSYWRSALESLKIHEWIKSWVFSKKDTKVKKGDEWIFFLKAKCQMAKSLDVGLG